MTQYERIANFEMMLTPRDRRWRQFSMLTSVLSVLLAVTAGALYLS
jgi:hypothetical protein